MSWYKEHGTCRYLIELMWCGYLNNSLHLVRQPDIPSHAMRLDIWWIISWIRSPWISWLYYAIILWGWSSIIPCYSSQEKKPSYFVCKFCYSVIPKKKNLAHYPWFQGKNFPLPLFLHSSLSPESVVCYAGYVMSFMLLYVTFYSCVMFCFVASEPGTP